VILVYVYISETPCASVLAGNGRTRGLRMHGVVSFTASSVCFGILHNNLFHFILAFTSPEGTTFVTLLPTDLKKIKKKFIASFYFSRHYSFRVS